MLTTPSISPQELLLGLASAALLMWALLYVARSGFDRAFAQPTAENERRKFFANLPLKHRSSQLPLVLSLFFHLLWASSLPWMEKLLQDEFPMKWKKYDLVVVQFKPTDSKLSLPPELRNYQAKQQQKEVDPDRELAQVSDPGIGNLRPAPKSEDAGGKEREKPPVERAEIVPRKRQEPRKAALEKSVPVPELALQARQKPLADPALSVAFGTPRLGEIRQPKLEVFQVASSGSGVQLQAMTPALADVAEAAGEAYGPAGLLGPPESGQMLLAELFEAGLFGDGVGAGWGDGVWGGDKDGDGLGEGKGGLSPIPRALHGIIMISTGTAALPEAAGVLTGNPVYTVHLEAPGFRRKWIFQVCARESAKGPSVKNGVLRVVSRGALDPPFALTKSPPRFKDLGSDPLPRRTVIYAAFDEEGGINDLRVVAGADPRTDEVLMASLKEWDFHPAFRDGRPVAVEALFGIPLR